MLAGKRDGTINSSLIAPRESTSEKKEYHTAYLYGYVLTIALGGFNIGKMINKP